MFAKLVGEGYDKPTGDSELPIDINYSKIVEWVVRIAFYSEYVMYLYT